MASGRPIRSSGVCKLRHLLKILTCVRETGWLGQVWGAHLGSLVKGQAYEVESYGLPWRNTAYVVLVTGTAAIVHVLPWGDKTRDTTPPNVVVRFQSYYSILWPIRQVLPSACFRQDRHSSGPPFTSLGRLGFDGAERSRLTQRLKADRMKKQKVLKARSLRRGGP